LTDLAAWGHLRRRIETARHSDVERRQFQLLHKQGDQLIFMDNATYDQIELSEDFVSGEKIVVSTDEVAYVRRAD
jgi:translation elongation factor P/translation initiation factor 5A